MRLTLVVVVSFLFLPVNSFFFGAAGGGGACGCSPACPPPPPPSPCGGTARAVARGAKTMSFDQPIYSQAPPQPPRVYSVPDELDLRAAAFGVPIQPQPQYTIFDILHNLGESGDSPAQQLVVADGSTNTDYFPKENDEDLTVSEQTGTGALYKSKEIRRAPAEPTVHVHRDSSVETTTVSSDNIGTDDSLDTNKCSSVVLRKLMIENISDSSAESKRNINIAAEGKFGGNVDVICSRGHFSYIFTSNLYCEATKGLTTCIAFRQSDKVRRRR
uniref:Ground-like domain-containing protein n=1 Tax=Caenorhabditis tropicalis TaxID=1561998 RepID=A0A1I7UXW6_9PELO